MSSYPSFSQLADQVNDKKLFNTIITRQQQFFETNPYKIEKLYSETAKKIYSQILNKYEVTHEFKPMENVWHQNERRVFVWYMILLVDLHSIDHYQPNSINWTQLTKVFFDKNPSFLEFQFANILKSKTKITWNQQEDTILIEAMNKQKPGKWNQVSKRIFYQSDGLLFKSPKHCRERWFNHLDHTKNKGSWTLQQDFIILKFIIENGKRWASIVKLLQNSRTEHMIKNRYNSLISKLKKNKKRRQQEIAQMVFKSLQAQVKNERREKKNKNTQRNSLQKKSQIFEQQNGLYPIIQKPQMSEELKSENSTDKIQQIKTQGEARNGDSPVIQNNGSIQEKNFIGEQGNNILNIYNPYGVEYMALNPFEYYYLCQQSAFLTVNSIFYY